MRDIAVLPFEPVFNGITSAVLSQIFHTQKKCTDKVAINCVEYTIYLNAFIGISPLAKTQKKIQNEIQFATVSTDPLTERNVVVNTIH